MAQLRLRCRSFLQMLGHFAGTVFPFSFTLDSIVDKVIYMDCGSRHCYNSIQRLVGQRSSLQPWAFLCFMSFQLADGANPGPDYLGSTDACLGPGGRFICKQQHFDVMAGASSLFSDQFICHLGTSKVVEIFATSNCHGGS